MGTDSILFQEIHEQPQVIERFLAEEQEAVRQLAAHMQAADIRQVAIAARGSSDNAGRYAQYLLGAWNRLPVMLTTPSLFTIYQRPPSFPRNTLILGISQSGKSPDIVSVLNEGRRQGCMTAAITNSITSPLADQTDHIIRLCAGEERSIAATKTYLAELFAIGLLSAYLEDDSARISTLAQAPTLLRQTLTLNRDIDHSAERYRDMRACVVIGRGFNYATAFEIALKLKELTYTMAEPYSSADFLHGPLALVEPGFPVILVAPTGAITPEMKGFIEQLHSRQAELLCISNDEELLHRGHHFALPQVPEWFSPLLAVLPAQLFAMHLAAARGYDPDHPRGLRKVTETH